jgi:hypothetical protein
MIERAGFMPALFYAGVETMSDPVKVFRCTCKCYFCIFRLINCREMPMMNKVLVTM